MTGRNCMKMFSYTRTNIPSIWRIFVYLFNRCAVRWIYLMLTTTTATNGWMKRDGPTGVYQLDWYGVPRLCEADVNWWFIELFSAGFPTDTVLYVIEDWMYSICCFRLPAIVGNIFEWNKRAFWRSNIEPRLIRRDLKPYRQTWRKIDWSGMCTRKACNYETWQALYSPPYAHAIYDICGAHKESYLYLNVKIRARVYSNIIINDYYDLLYTKKAIIWFGFRNSCTSWRDVCAVCVLYITSGRRQR